MSIKQNLIHMIHAWEVMICEKMYNRRKVKSTTRKDIYDVIAGSICAWEGAILVTQFASATAAATAAAASLAADANFLP